MHGPCIMPSLRQSLFYVSVEFYGDHKTVCHKVEVNLATISFWGYYQIKNSGVGLSMKHIHLCASSRVHVMRPQDKHNINCSFTKAEKQIAFY